MGSVGAHGQREVDAFDSADRVEHHEFCLGGHDLVRPDQGGGDLDPDALEVDLGLVLGGIPALSRSHRAGQRDGAHRNSSVLLTEIAQVAALD